MDKKKIKNCPWVILITDLHTSEPRKVKNMYVQSSTITTIGFNYNHAVSTFILLFNFRIYICIHQITEKSAL